jgi:hypothetical protein
MLRVLPFLIVGIFGAAAFAYAGADGTERLVLAATQTDDTNARIPAGKQPCQPAADALSIPLGHLVLRSSRAGSVPIAAARLSGSAICDRAKRCRDWSSLLSRNAIARLGAIQTSQIRLQI